MKRHAIFGVSVVIAFAWAVACNQPTEIVVTVTTDVPCGQVKSTAIAIGPLANIQGKPATSESALCAGTSLGSLVVTPSGADDAEVAIEVALGTNGTTGADCLTQWNVSTVAANCIYASRDQHFIPHQREDVPVLLAAGCLGVVCAVGQTCNATSHQCESTSTCDGGCGDASPDGPIIPPAQTAMATTSTDVTCAVGVHGLKCWGYGSFGEIGLGKNLDNETQVPSAATIAPLDVAAVSGGGEHFCALLTSTSIECWGYDGEGQVIPGQLGGANVPTPTIVNGLPPVKQVQAGFHTTCALMVDGTVSCWGANDYGQIGQGNTSVAEPVTAVALPTVTALGSGPNADTFCAILGGSLKCWGSNAGTQLGTTQGANATSPIDVAGFTGPVAAVSLGHDFLCALIKDGTVECLGANNLGQLGDATTTKRPTPAPVKNLSGAQAISAGYAHACAILASGAVQCWGDNTQFQIGDGTLADGGVDFSPRTTPSQVVGLTSGVVAVNAGFARTCAMTSSGVKCWGSSPSGATLGDGKTQTSASPVDVANFP